ncbi:hypothetical protein M9H77_13099 [Catharanthus roseus]|uniref:Uncharacterized protein n=1 Tax=Catharanthus roseus TaxID=4058 RepID=A0ACC0BJC9_CATRO|nr:hypothetical protein M9H77_13099 [Catharanthus roseus]
MKICSRWTQNICPHDEFRIGLHLRENWAHLDHDARRVGFDPTAQPHRTHTLSLSDSSFFSPPLEPPLGSLTVALEDSNRCLTGATGHRLTACAWFLVEEERACILERQRNSVILARSTCEGFTPIRKVETVMLPSLWTETGVHCRSSDFLWLLDT